MTHILLRWSTLLVFLLVSLATTSAIASEEQTYTIKKGDTLWDLSQKFIDDPYYWPNVWAKNPDITNPHLIFPGQKITILDGKIHIVPAYPEAKQEKETIGAIDTPEITKMVEAVTVKSGHSGNGFILTNEKPLGIILDSVDNRVLLSQHDTVFIKLNNLDDAVVGNKFGIFLKSTKVEHPHTGRNIGSMMNDLGYLEIVKIHEDTIVAKIREVFREITRGAELFPYIPQKHETTLQPGVKDLTGYIIATRDHKPTVTTNDIIFVNLGSEEGLVSGNLFYISTPRSATDLVIKQAGDIKIPDAVLGAAVIVATRDHTATAIVIKSVDAAYVGDKITIVAN